MAERATRLPDRLVVADGDPEALSITTRWLQNLEAKGGTQGMAAATPNAIAGPTCPLVPRLRSSAKRLGRTCVTCQGTSPAPSVSSECGRGARLDGPTARSARFRSRNGACLIKVHPPAGAAGRAPAGYLTDGAASLSHMGAESLHSMLARLLRRVGSLRIVRGTIQRPRKDTSMTQNQTNRTDEPREGMACSQPRDESAAEREYREKVRASVERVRTQNREILDRLATR